jgi:branched-chain amino acid transport system permease protein
MTTKVPNFAHGSLATVGFYVCLTASRLWTINPYVSLPLGFALGACAGGILYVMVVRPLIKRGANFVILMIATLAFDLLLLSVFNIYADYLARTWRITSRYFLLRGFDFSLGDQPGLFLIAPIVMVAEIGALHMILTHTRFGVAMRATVENPSLASVVGINVDLVYATSWLVAGGLAGASGVLMSLWFMGNPDIGASMLISIFAASVVGGLLSIYGAFLGGFLVGLVEVLGTSCLSGIVGAWIIPYRPIIPLIMMILTLLTLPKGIAAMKWKETFRRLKV